MGSNLLDHKISGLVGGAEYGIVESRYVKYLIFTRNFLIAEFTGWFNSELIQILGSFIIEFFLSCVV